MTFEVCFFEDKKADLSPGEEYRLTEYLLRVLLEEEEEEITSFQPHQAD